MFGAGDGKLGTNGRGLILVRLPALWRIQTSPREHAGKCKITVVMKSAEG